MKNYFSKLITGLFVLVLALFLVPASVSANSNGRLPEDGLYIAQERLTLEIRTVNVSVAFTVHGGEELSIRYIGAEENELFYNLNGNLLEIYQRNENYGIFNWGWTSNMGGELYVSIPVNSREFNSITINTVSGAVNIDSFIAETLKVNSVSGLILASGIRTSGDFELKTVSGAIDVDAVISRNIRLGSVSGRVRLNDGGADENINLSTVSGAADISGAVALNISITSVSGRANISESRAENISVGSTSGRIEASEIITINLNINSTSGAAHLRNSEVRDEVNIRTHSGAITLENVEGEHRLNLNSRSGRITVDGQRHN